ncbi:hypothetical protein LIER_18409 [Lithospermum erythrorhizon]|uniref:RNase H type-1 domain-containing protein n=1 Tax=Lithospermum erythrorhizon TaxID=34254 RepID=A0AAV3QJB7_LITER
MEVVTDQPFRHILENPSRSGRNVKWATELSKFDLHYKPSTSIKAQALANFMVEWTHDAGEAAPELVNLIEDSREKVWLLYVDGASNPGGSEAGILLWSLEGNKIEYALRFAFTATNNDAEVRKLAKLFCSCHTEHVPRERNQEADRLSQLATTGYEMLSEATVVEWVEEEVFRTKELMSNDVLEGKPGPPVIPGSVGARGSAWGHVREPYQCKSPNGEDPTVGHVLAPKCYGCLGPLGSRYSGAPPENRWVQEICHCGSRLLYQVGRSEATYLAVPGAEIYADTSQVTYYDEPANKEGMRLNFYLLEGKRVVTVDKMAMYKKKVAAYYNTKVWSK